MTRHYCANLACQKEIPCKGIGHVLCRECQDKKISVRTSYQDGEIDRLRRKLESARRGLDRLEHQLAVTEKLLRQQTEAAISRLDQLQAIRLVLNGKVNARDVVASVVVVDAMEGEYEDG